MCYGYCCRYADYNFEQVLLTSSEKAAVSEHGKAVQGFLAWRRTLLLPCACLLSVATLMQMVLTAMSYSGGASRYFLEMVGLTLWKEVFCPIYPSKGWIVECQIDGLASVYYVNMITDVLLMLISFAACVLMFLAACRWSNYRKSSATLRTAFGSIFLAPFALLLLFPPAAFIDAPAVQTFLCKMQLDKSFPDSESGLTLKEDVCARPIDEWSDALNQTLTEQGRIRDRRTGTCPHAEQLIADAAVRFVASGDPCEDDNKAIAEGSKGAGAGVITSCAMARTAGLCTAENPQWRVAVQRACPIECGLCVPAPPPPGPAATCEDHDARFARYANVANAPDSCAAAVAKSLCTNGNAEIKAFVTKACPLSCGECEAACEDNDVAFTLAGGEYASRLQNCARAASPRKWGGANGPRINLCTQGNNATIKAFVRSNCPASCQLCTPPASRQRMNRRALQTPSKAEKGVNMALSAALSSSKTEGLTMYDGCIDPIVLQATRSIEVALSDEVIIGAFGLRRGASVMLLLIPAALGLALGAGQGSTLAKALLPSSRLPARIAAIVVGLSLPFLAALLGVVNQLLGSHFGTLACLCVLAMLGVWLPRGPLTTMYRLVCGQGVHTPSGKGAKAHPIIDPAPAKAVVADIGKRKWLVTGWMLLAIIFVIAFLSFATAYSLVTEQLAETQRQWNLNVRRAVRNDQYGPILSLVLTGMSTVLAVIAKTYLAQIFYTDAAIASVVSIWHTEKSDDAETAAQRTSELANVAQALGLDAEARQATDRSKQRVVELA